MNKQKSYISGLNKLYLIPTPIGNFDDMTFRAIETLKNVDIIYCEDTRVTYRLLSHFNIETPLKAYHIFNENVACDEILEELRNGKNIGLVSDAGLPVISDPGYQIAKLAIENEFEVVSLPGANAALTALISSGIPANHFFFYGFLDHKVSQKEKELDSLKDFKDTLIFYEAPHRIIETLTSIYKVLGDREVCIARELTKHYEEYTRGYVSEILNSNPEFKGEIVVVVHGATITKEQETLNDLTILEHFEFYKKQNLNDKDAMKRVAKDRNISKSDVYKTLLESNK